MPRWNNTKDAYDNSRYDPQYPDENTEGGVLLDHSKLYVTNLPKGLNEHGLESLFGAYGNVVRIHLSKDPTKRYAIVTFESASDARAAMMKLNKSGTMQLNISVAHKKSKQDQKERDHKPSRLSRNYDGRSTIEDCEDVGNNSIQWNAEGQNNMYEEEMLDDDIDLEEELDVDLRLQMLKLQEAEIKIKQQKLLLMNQPRKLNQQSNRCFTADGKIIVRNVGDRSNGDKHVSWAVEPDGYSSGGADAYTIPALQREASRACVACGAPADAYCARCGLAPYCSARCQRTDWQHRHRAVCHNLARMSNGPPDMKQSEADVTVPPAQPLRRPHSLNRSREQNTSRDPEEDNDSQKKHQQRESRGPRNRQPQNNRYPRNQTNQNTGRQHGGQNDARSMEEEESFEPKNPKPQTPQPNKPAQKLTPAKQKPIADKPAPVIAKSQPPAISQPAANPAPVASKEAASKPQPVPEPVPKTVNKEIPVLPPGSVSSVTPERKITPKKYLPETLPIGSTVILSVEAAANTKRPGFVCLAMHASTSDHYQMLCDEYGQDCEAITEKYKPSPGDTFSYLNAEDGAWYRARCLTPTTAAFIDSGIIVTIAADNCRKLPAKYEEIVEFCCQLDAEGVKVGEHLNCELVEKLGQSYKVTLNPGEESRLGELFRWLPPVELPAAAATAVVLPEVPRPAVTPGAVVLVEGDAERCFVRSAHAETQRRFDQLLQEVLLRGLQGKLVPLKQPPLQGDIVVGKFTDGHHYRALCKRTNIKQNKYMLEYIEYGNIHIGHLEDLFECPPELTLTAEPTVVSLVKLRLSCKSLSAAATEYLEQLRDDSVELTLSLPDGSPSGASGCEVCLTVTKGGESVNKRLDELSTPQWKQLQQKGVDVVATEPIMLNDERLRYLELPAEGCEVEVLDFSMLDAGSLSACPAHHPDIARVFNELGEEMAEYCTSEIGSVPYLPRLEETCIAQCEKTGRWMRAVVCSQEGGAGGASARVCVLDTGEVRDVAVVRLRKMLPDFLRLPVLSSLLDVRGFPKEPTQEMLAKAKAHMNITDNRGKLRVTKCVKEDSGVYNVEAPELLRAMGL